jgi:CheY-like chemotaxis protein
MLIRELAAEDLEEAGYDVVTMATGDEALALLESGDVFDLLFTDIRMPGLIDGWELAAEAKRLVPGLKVIYSTGLDESDQGLAPSDRLIQKPYRLDVLLKLLDELRAA